MKTNVQILIAVAVWLSGNWPLSAQPERFELRPVGSFQSETNAWGFVSLSGKHALLAGQNGRYGGNTVLDVIDVSESTRPVPVHSLVRAVGSATESHCRSIALGSNHLYMAGVSYTNAVGWGWWWVDAVKLDAPSGPHWESGILEFSKPVMQLYWSRDLLYVLVEDQLLLFDARNPLNLVQVGSLTPTSPPTGFRALATLGEKAYLTGDSGEHFLQVVDMRDLTHLTVVGATTLPYLGNWASCLAVNYRSAYVGFRSVSCGGGIVAVDVSDPSHPKVTSFYRMGGCVYSLAVLGNHLLSIGHALDGEDGLHLFDISDPSQPVCVAVAGDGAQSAFVDDGRAYVVSPYSGRLLIWDIIELPAVTRHFIANGKLNLQWNEPARGMRLQRTLSLTNPDWQDMLGSENTNFVSLPIWGGSEFFRLAKP